MAGGAIELDAHLARSLAHHGQGRQVGAWTVITIEALGEGPARSLFRMVIADAAGRQYEGRYEHTASTRPWGTQSTATFTSVRTPALEGARS